MSVAISGRWPTSRSTIEAADVAQTMVGFCSTLLLRQARGTSVPPVGSEDLTWVMAATAMTKTSKHRRCLPAADKTYQLRDEQPRQPQAPDPYQSIALKAVKSPEPGGCNWKCEAIDAASRQLWRVLLRANSWNSWPVISKNRHEFHEFHEEDHLTVTPKNWTPTSIARARAAVSRRTAGRIGLKRNSVVDFGLCRTTIYRKHWSLSSLVGRDRQEAQLGPNQKEILRCDL